MKVYDEQASGQGQGLEPGAFRLAIGYPKAYDFVITLVDNCCLSLSDLHHTVLGVVSSKSKCRKLMFAYGRF